MKNEIFYFAHLWWRHSGWASNILIGGCWCSLYPPQFEKSSFEPTLLLVVMVHICDAIKQNESEVENFSFLEFWHFLLGYYLSLNVVKPHRDWAIGSWEIAFWVIAKNNKKQKKLSALFSYILKLILASSDSFCLIASHVDVRGKRRRGNCNFVYI